MNNSLVCVDASVVVRFFVGPHSEEMLRVLAQVSENQLRLAAPTLLYDEVANALYQYGRLQRLRWETVRLAFGA